MNDAFPQIKVSQLKDLPIRDIDFSSSGDVLLHDSIVEIVRQLLDLRSSEKNTRVGQTKKLISRRIEALEQDLDNSVFELYRLNKEECRVVIDGCD